MQKYTTKIKNFYFSLIGHFIQLQIDKTITELIKYIPSSINYIMIMYKYVIFDIECLDHINHKMEWHEKWMFDENMYSHDNSDHINDVRVIVFNIWNMVICDAKVV